MQIEILSIGNEVLSGQTVNTNAAYLSRKLAEMGLIVSRHTVIPDQPTEIQAAIRNSSSSLIITTGGLGPTIDDLTLSALKPIFSSAPKLLDNPVGPAQGAYFHNKARAVIALPGVPREMIRMFEESASPLIEQLFEKIPRRYVVSRSLCLFKEVEIDPFLRQMQETHPEVSFGIYPSLGSVRVEFVGPHFDELKKLNDEIAKTFPTHTFEGTLAEAVHAELIGRKETLALAESCTGGAISARLAALAGASKFLLGCVVAYSNPWKERLLGVSSETLKTKGAVSRETVEEMAAGLLERTEADWAIAVSGIAGPTGGTKEKPVGTIYIAVARRGGLVDVGRIQARSDRASAIEEAVQTALAALWRRLAHNQMSL